MSMIEEKQERPVIEVRWVLGEMERGQAKVLDRMDERHQRQFESEWEAQRSRAVQWGKSQNSGVSGMLVIAVALENLTPTAMCFTAIDCKSGEISVAEMEKIVKDYMVYKNHQDGWTQVSRKQFRALPGNYLQQLAVIFDTPMRHLPEMEYGVVIPSWVVNKRTLREESIKWAELVARRKARRKSN